MKIKNIFFYKISTPFSKPDMNEKRSDADATALNGNIYVVGGFNGQECLNSVEFFDRRTFQWTKITPMKSKRSGVSAVTLDDKIFAVGGFNEPMVMDRLSTAEVYNTTTNSWEYIANMISPRSNFGIEVVDQHLVVTGGFNGYQTTYNAEAYDQINDKWFKLRDMFTYRSGVSCVTIRNIPVEHIGKFAGTEFGVEDLDCRL